MTRSRLFRIAGNLVLLIVFFAQPVLGQQVDPAKLLPGDTFAFLNVRDCNAIREKFKQTAIYQLYKDPAMQPFIAPTEKNIRDLIDEKLREGWSELGLEKPPEKVLLPQGRFVLAVRLATTVIKVPNYDFSSGDWTPDSGPPPIKGWREQRIPGGQVVILADMGDQIEQMKELVEQVSSASVDKGWKRRTETIRGIEVVSITKPAPPASEDHPVPPQPAGTTCYAFHNSMAIYASTMDLMRDVVVRMRGSDAESLADDEGFKSCIKGLSASGDVSFYLRAESVRDLVREMTKPDEREDVEQKTRMLGLDNVTGLGGTLSLVPSKDEQMRIQMMLGVKGEKRGIPALLTPTSMTTTPNRLLTRGLGGFVVANYGIGKLFDQINKIVVDMGGPHLGMTMQGMMMITGSMGAEGGRPPVDMRKEVLGQLSGPITVLSRIDKPYTAPDSSSMFLGIGVTDRNVLDEALGRIHQTLIAHGNEQLRREFLNHTIYMFEGPGMSFFRFLPFAPFQLSQSDEGGADSANMLAFSVLGDQFVFGKVPMVEQVIRDLRRKDLEGIGADPMYAHASRYLPSQAGMFSYGNDQISTERAWAQLRNAGAEYRKRSLDEQPAEPEDFRSGPRRMQHGLGGLPMGSGVGPLQMFGEDLFKYCDFTALPDFQQARKYFGASVGYVTGTDQGIEIEIIYLNAPKEE